MAVYKVTQGFEGFAAEERYRRQIILGMPYFLTYVFKQIYRVPDG